jgi:hypothetical protein
MLFLLKFDMLLLIITSNNMSDRYIPIPLRLLQQQQQQQQQQQLMRYELPKQLMPPRAPVHRTNSLPPRPTLLNIKSETDFPSLAKRNTIHGITDSLTTMAIAKEEEWRPTTPEFGKFEYITEEDLRGQKPDAGNIVITNDVATTTIVTATKDEQGDVWHE